MSEQPDPESAADSGQSNRASADAAPVTVAATGDDSVAIRGDVSDTLIVAGPLYRLGLTYWWQWLGLFVFGGVLVIGSVVAIFRYIREPPPSPQPTPAVIRMQGGLNVAVADFSVVGGQGRGVARQLAQDFFSRLQEQLRTPSGQYLGAEVWPPSQTHLIEGEDANARIGQAEKRAQEIGADILVFGEIRYDPVAEKTTFQPEFYVSPTKLVRGESLVGHSEFGPPIEEPKDVTQSEQSFAFLHDRVLNRAQSLARFIYGVGYYERNEFDKSADQLRAADQLWDEPSATQPLSDGKELVYTWSGFATGRNGDFETAIAYFDRALARQPEYARAMMGTAEMRFQIAGAQRQCAAADVDINGLHQALDEFKSARVAGYQPPASDIQSRVAFGIGQVLTCLSQARLEDDWSEADSQFRSVITDYEKPNTRLKDLAADAHGNLGFITAFRPGAATVNEQAARDRSAIDEYMTADKLSIRPDRRAVYTRMLGFLHCRLGEANEATIAYSDAAELAPDAEKPMYQGYLEAIKQQTERPNTARNEWVCP